MPLPAGPPAGAIEEARTAAQTGVPLAALLHTYRIGQSVAWEAMIQAVSAMPISTSRAAPTCCRGARGTCSRTSIASPCSSPRSTRASGTGSRAAASSVASSSSATRSMVRRQFGELGYELATSHRGVVGWGGRGTVLSLLAARLGLRLLVVSARGQTAWAWLGGAAQSDHGLRGVLLRSSTRTGLAFGRVGEGAGGSGALIAKPAARIGSPSRPAPR